MPTQQWPDTFDPSPPQSPAPVAGAVEANLTNLQTWLVCYSIGGTAKPSSETLGLWVEALESVLTTPQPAPAVAVEARDLAPVIAWLEGGCDPKQAAQELRLLAARSAPAVAEKVPLTEDRIRRLQDAIEGECDGMAIGPEHARAILEWVDGVGSGSAQEGQANG